MTKKHGRYYWVDIWTQSKRARRSLITDKYGLVL